jgi:hypothetical protein
VRLGWGAVSPAADEECWGSRKSLIDRDGIFCQTLRQHAESAEFTAFQGGREMAQGASARTSW